MCRPPPRSPRTYTRFPSTSLFRSDGRQGPPIRRRCRAAPQAPFEEAFCLVDEKPPVAFRLGQERFSSFGSDRERSEEHTSELQSLMRISYAVFCLKQKTRKQQTKCQPLSS